MKVFNENIVRRIDAQEWEERSRSIPTYYHKQCLYGTAITPGGVPYLFTPYHYACKGDSRLLRLKYDSSLASLRLWAFLFSEKERLFLAKEHGWRIFAAMKDLGQVPIITYCIPKSLTFYADELWWAPCFAEKPHLLEKAADFGATEELCFVRAALGAYQTLEYFPRPDLSFAGVGACCDDFSAIMQLIEWQGHPIHWWEIPARFDQREHLAHFNFVATASGGSEYQESAVRFLIGQFQGIIEKLRDITGHAITTQELRRSVADFNRLRVKVRRLRELVYRSEKPPLPGLEMLLAEFIALHYCSDPRESHAVLDELLETVEYRTAHSLSPLSENPVRLFWVSPTTDAAVITLVEDCGGCVAGTEYMIGHTSYLLDESKGPLDAIAENYMDDPMIGTSGFRARKVAELARYYRAEGVLITGISGASHCPFEERAIADIIHNKLDLPVLSIDIPYSSSTFSSQITTRIESFIELLQSRRKSTR